MAIWSTGTTSQSTTDGRAGDLICLDPTNQRTLQALLDDLRARGWEEGRNILLEGRFAGSDPARFPELAAELVELEVDLIVAANTQAAVAARSKTTAIPIILVGVADPVGSGLVASLARPGGNVTGMANQIESVSAKSFELLKESKPRIKHIGIVFSPNNSPSVRTQGNAGRGRPPPRPHRSANWCDKAGGLC